MSIAIFDANRANNDSRAPGNDYRRRWLPASAWFLMAAGLAAGLSEKTRMFRTHTIKVIILRT